ncbi:winged helix-turn-helix transcriptional regulator [Gluconacetobacter sacchari]|uniref:Helix-turn-helix transcriptional regulator n=3 Tax=Gluconacetobacter sacchari TaxID=92759 RepID=A0A7W4IBJ6_9PROT|nr:helix-turn-helix domain-containing protein [Gluconacetobacter sacchari]MBB2159782.1 helix-turn-helix transcriptional regulator [Gluconacetobacter sacchari]
MRSKGFEGMACSIAAVMGAIGDRWALLIMRDLLLGIRRYDDLRQSSGVTNATLSDRLKLLTENGLVERRQYQTRPERFEYQPTEKGRDLNLLMQALVQIGDQWNLSSLEGPPLDFIDRRTGHGVKLMTVDRETSEPVERDQLGVRPGRGADALMTWRLSRGPERADALVIRSDRSQDAGPPPVPDDHSSASNP